MQPEAAARREAVERASGRVAAARAAQAARGGRARAREREGGRSGRATGRAGRAQLDLFDGGPPIAEENVCLGLLRAVDVDRLTPLEALALVDKLKRLAAPPAT